MDRGQTGQGRTTGYRARLMAMAGITLPSAVQSVRFMDGVLFIIIWRPGPKAVAHNCPCRGMAGNALEHHRRALKTVAP